MKPRAVSPTALITVRLTDSVTNHTRTTVIKRPPSPPKEPTPKFRVYENEGAESARPPTP